MGDVVNLRLARKARDRADADARAAANRSRFGRTKAERASAEREADRLARVVDGARLERPDDG